jgi:hypothetical protein
MNSVDFWDVVIESYAPARQPLRNHIGEAGSIKCRDGGKLENRIKLVRKS